MKAEDLFWKLADELQAENPRVVPGPIMNGPCLRVGKEFLGLVDYKGSGLVVKLPKQRVAEIIASGVTCETPAGRFTRCITVRLTNRTTGVEFYHYFAPGVGEVRMESENIHYELTEFRLEPASEDALATSAR